jgi:hypothetical protein
VHGHDFNDPSMAATLSAANIPGDIFNPPCMIF